MRGGLVITLRMADPHASIQPGLIGPLETPHAIPAGAPAAVIELPWTCRAIVVDGAGVLSWRAPGGEEVTLTNPLRGTPLAFRATHILTTNTAALIVFR